MGAIALIAVGEDRQYTPAHLAFAEELARRAALAVDDARLCGAAQRATQTRDGILDIVAHDLRNPLGAIAMYASALAENRRPRTSASATWSRRSSSRPSG